MTATTLQLRRGTTAQHATFTGAHGEVTVDTTKKSLVVHDGATAGGTPLATAAALAAVDSAQNAARVAALVDTALTGNPTATTQAASDNSTRLANTGWVRSALGTILTALGFTSSFGATSSYIKFPSVLGGLVVQFGKVSYATPGSTGVTFPLAFPNACRAAYGNIVASSATTLYSVTVMSINTTGMALMRAYYNGSSIGGAAEDAYWLAIGN